MAFTPGIDKATTSQGDMDQGPRAITFGQYNGLQTPVDGGYLCRFNVENEEVQISTPKQIIEGIEIPFDSVMRLRPGKFQRYTSLYEYGREAGSTYTEGELRRLSDETFLEIFPIDSEEERVARVYKKAKQKDKVPYLTEMLVENVKDGTIEYHKARRIYSLRETGGRSPGDEVTQVESGSWFGDSIGYMYWVERFERVEDGLKLLGTDQVFVESLPDMVAPEVSENPDIVDEEDRKWYGPQLDGQHDNAERIQLLLTYLDRNSPV